MGKAQALSLLGVFWLQCTTSWVMVLRFVRPVSFDRRFPTSTQRYQTKGNGQGGDSGDVSVPPEELERLLQQAFPDTVPTNKYYGNDRMSDDDNSNNAPTKDILTLEAVSILEKLAQQQEELAAAAAAGNKTTASEKRTILSEEQDDDEENELDAFDDSDQIFPKSVVLDEKMYLEAKQHMNPDGSLDYWGSGTLRKELGRRVYEGFVLGPKQFPAGAYPPVNESIPLEDLIKQATPRQMTKEEEDALYHKIFKDEQAHFQQSKLFLEGFTNETAALEARRLRRSRRYREQLAKDSAILDAALEEWMVDLEALPIQDEPPNDEEEDDSDKDYRLDDGVEEAAYTITPTEDATEDIIVDVDIERDNYVVDYDDSVAREDNDSLTPYPSRAAGDWVPIYDSSSGETYYRNKATGEIQLGSWED